MKKLKFDDVVKCFLHIVKLYHDKTALQYKDNKITYRQLDIWSDNVALQLQAKGVKAGMGVGIVAGRCLQLAVAMLGILKAGGFYVPINEEEPENKINFFIEDSRLDILCCTSKEWGQANESFNIVVVDDCIDNNQSDSLKKYDTCNILYRMYTSGTTGRQKGCDITHKNLINFTGNQDFFDFNQKQRLLQVSSPAFDACTFEVWGTLLNGGTLVFTDKINLLSAETLKKIFLEYGITATLLTPNLFNQICDQDHTIFSSLEHLIVGGSALSVPHIRKVKNYSPELRITNAYGPTENTVIATCHQIRSEDLHRSRIPIGKAINGVIIFVLNSEKKQVKSGEIGELCVGGASLCKGYFNRDSLNSEKFIEFNNMILYRTGDYVKEIVPSLYDYIGRMDNQVKINGYRVELDEIENVLSKRESVKDAVVVNKKDIRGNNYLCAYYISDEELDINDLKSYLSSFLPAYMIPDFFMRIDEIPLTLNGKINKKVLPEPNDKRVSENYIPPFTEIEKKIAEIWCEILGVEKVGIMDNFFKIGGNSLKAVRVISKMSIDFKIDINDLFQYQNISTLAQRITYKEGSLKNKIAEIKEIATEFIDFSSEYKQSITEYNQRIEKYHSFGKDKTGKNYRKILLAGSTGYLGINLLYSLLKDTESKIYILIRGKNKNDAERRIRSKFSFYFQYNTFDKYRDRIIIQHGDLTRDNLGLTEKQFDSLSMSIDCVINAAANVKHYGDYDDFHNVNVKGTERLITFAVKSRKKDYHHISTTGVATGNITDKSYYYFTEYDYDIGQKVNNHYIKTKIEAEKIVVQAREKGLNVSIYRVGNLVSDSKTGKFQENIEDNGFYRTIKSIIMLGELPDFAIKTLNFSFIDYTSRAITLLINQGTLKNETYHVFNHRLISLLQLSSFINDYGYNIKIKSLNDFLDFLYKNYEDKELGDYVRNVMLHSQMFESVRSTRFQLASEKTVMILKNLGFEWPKINDLHIKSMLDYCREIGFLKEVNLVKEERKMEVMKDVIDNSETDLRNLARHSENDNAYIDSSEKINLEISDKEMLAHFRNIVSEVPNKEAFTHGDRSITYRELDDYSNRVAALLQKKGYVESGKQIGILTIKSIEQVVATLGVIKTGGQYILIDERVLPEDICSIVMKSGCEMIISVKKHIGLLNRLQWSCSNLKAFLCLDSEEPLSEKEHQYNDLMNKGLWEFIGKKSTDEISGGGWKNSYNGEYFSQAEMDEYGDNILKKLGPWLGNKPTILEIGCASGISMFRIAPYTELYYGTDLSEAIISKNRDIIEKQGYKNIKLNAMPADKIDEIQERDFDIIIINSVIQCFHGHNYLRGVLRKAIDLVHNKALIFLGDIMDADLKEEMVKSFIDYSLDSGVNLGKVKTDWSQELFISRGFLENIQSEFPQIEKIEFSKKIHTIENELTRFRFDAMLFINKTGDNNAVKSKFQFGKKDLPDSSDFDSQLLDRENDATQISEIMNHKLIYRTIRKLAGFYEEGMGK